MGKLKMDFKLDKKMMKKLESDMKELGKVPQRSVSKAARAGAKVAFRDARRNAPVLTGDLRKGLVMKAEKRTVLGKRVYGIMMNPKMNDKFVKISKAGKRSFYPASQEWGFQHVYAGYIPGYRYLKHSIDNNVESIRKATLDTLGKDIDKALKG